MASSPISIQRNPTKGYAPIPCSLIENQALLTHGELSLALVVLRRGGNGIPVSDRNWQSWTGLSPRLKEMAVKGLREKGLKVDGKGEAARFSWETQNWHHYLKVTPAVKPRTAGRQVDPKPGAKVHPECRERGCAMLRPDCVSGGLSLVAATPVAQPVSQTTAGTVNEHRQPQQASTVIDKPNVSLILAAPVAQRVSQTPAELWAKTLAVLQGIFPLIGVTFLFQLLATVKVLCSDVTDPELAEAVEIAWQQSAGRAQSAGLFLKTVPEALGALRRDPGGTRAAARGAPANRKSKLEREFDEIVAELEGNVKPS